MAVSEMVERVTGELAVRVPEAQSWEDCAPMAMAAIAAMREPTQGMLAADAKARGWDVSDRAALEG
nr:hypothetical protein [uncultured Rhodopila sp.]